MSDPTRRASLTLNPKYGAALWLGDRLVARIGATVEDSRVSPEEPEPRWLRDAMVFVNAVNAALSTTPAPDLGGAWAAAEAALAPDQRLVMWQDRGGPRFIQVLAPDLTITDDDSEPVDDVMAPIISILADYPSKGLGKGVVIELLAIADRLREARS